jgi:peptide/nickel transport system substrate-binding protein
VLLNPDPEQARQLAVRFPTQLIRFDAASTLRLMLDTTRPPFDSLTARKAVATGLDRTAVVSALKAYPARPSCQILPPVLVGYWPYCPYGIGPGAGLSDPSLSEARKLVRRSGTAGKSVEMLVPDELRDAGFVIVRYLRQLGYRVHASVIGDDTEYFERVSDPRTRPEVHLARWSADLLSASSFASLARCSSRGPEGLNTTGFCDARSEQLITRALTLQELQPAETAGGWRAVDRRLSNMLPWVPLASAQGALLVGSRVNTVVEMPMLGPALERITFDNP